MLIVQDYFPKIFLCIILNVQVAVCNYKYQMKFDSQYFAKES